MHRRLIHRTSALKAVRELDAFPKVPESYTQTTTSGGTISILSYILIIILVISEIKYYSETQFKFQYGVDTDFDSKLKINVDITVAMPCDTIGADILDVTNENNVQAFGKLEEHPTHFELTPQQRAHWLTMQRINIYIREQHHAIQDLLWKEGYTNLLRGLPAREIPATGDFDACRLYGTLIVNKVAGNFHITAGKHIPHPIGHAHLSAFLTDKDYNFSHRIEMFSFGDPISGIFDPLEGDEKITDKNFQLYQYYLKIVPTEVYSGNHEVKTYQYSVTEQEREINHDSGSHGIPGIYFKYDMSSVKVKVIKHRSSFWHFLVRLCGIVGGIYATSGIVNNMVSFIVSICSSKPAKEPAYSKLVKLENLETHNLNNSLNKLVTEQPQNNVSLIENPFYNNIRLFSDDNS
ncbi:endoplasmic reticulum-Golgi intermediate compartment protein 2 [Centruroides vittatus]|uniref:endoplasmic reticulum-Golgi intermediate compartment protein 2 n=1 Tax=Centruroides vittatus TaxID=120091 RepID=UPI0035100FD7